MEDLSKLLKDCPKGTKLYSPLFGEVTFGYVSAGNTIWVSSSNGKTMLMFTRNGKYCLNFHSEDDIDESAECLLFPSKDCRTWEGWKPPVESNFKVGDWVVRKDGETFYGGNYAEQITLIDVDEKGKCIWLSSTSWVNDYDIRLWTIADAKDGDVLVNDAGCIFINAGFEEDDKVTLACYCYVSVQGIFYEEDHKTGSWLYASHIHPATKEQRDLLFAKMKEAGYEWDEKKKELRKIKPHYNISNFKVGMPVLIRNYNNNQWEFTFFGRYQKDKEYPFRCADSYTHIQCIPYEGNEALLGTTDMPSEEFINW